MYDNKILLKMKIHFAQVFFFYDVAICFVTGLEPFYINKENW